MPARYPALWLGSVSCSQLFNLGGGGGKSSDMSRLVTVVGDNLGLGDRLLKFELSCGAEPYLTCGVPEAHVSVDLNCWTPSWCPVSYCEKKSHTFEVSSVVNKKLAFAPNLPVTPGARMFQVGCVCL